ncbi:hypothetical protein [Flavobacterium sp. RS13.1]|uniref:hypothetical protein n=1 Tax=Flavobacterium sp. RS13.1 TaxID=3400345 RepID=UPI003AB0B882
MRLKSTLNLLCLFVAIVAFSQIDNQLPSERKIMKHPVTGQELIFLTTKFTGDSKTYPTHSQWTADGQ